MHSGWLGLSNNTINLLCLRRNHFSCGIFICLFPLSIPQCIAKSSNAISSIITSIEFHVFPSILARSLVSQRIEKERVIVKEKIPRNKSRYILQKLSNQQNGMIKVLPFTRFLHYITLKMIFVFFQDNLSLDLVVSIYLFARINLIRFLSYYSLFYNKLG